MNKEDRITSLTFEDYRIITLYKILESFKKYNLQSTESNLLLFKESNLLIIEILSDRVIASLVPYSIDSKGVSVSNNLIIETERLDFKSLNNLKEVEFKISKFINSLYLKSDTDKGIADLIIFTGLNYEYTYKIFSSLLNRIGNLNIYKISNKSTIISEGLKYLNKNNAENYKMKFNKPVIKLNTNLYIYQKNASKKIKKITIKEGALIFKKERLSFTLEQSDINRDYIFLQYGKYKKQIEITYPFLYPLDKIIVEINGEKDLLYIDFIYEDKLRNKTLVDRTLIQL